MVRVFLPAETARARPGRGSDTKLANIEQK